VIRHGEKADMSRKPVTHWTIDELNKTVARKSGVHRERLAGNRGRSGMPMPFSDQRNPLCQAATLGGLNEVLWNYIAISIEFAVLF
jgi:hypothetical protein